MPYLKHHFLYLFLLYAAIKDLQERKIPKVYFILFPSFFFFLLAFPFEAADLKKSLITLIYWILSLFVSYPLFYFTGSGGADWKLFSLILSVLPFDKSIFLLFLSTPFSLLLFYILEEDIPFAFSLFLSAVPLLSLFS